MKLNKMSIFPLNNDMIPGTCSFVKHLKRIQLCSFMPLLMGHTSFSQVSKSRLVLSLVVFVMNLIHQWAPELSLQWNVSGPVSAVLTLLEKIIHSLVPAIFVTTALINRRQFEKTTNKLLFILKSLGLWNYRMFVSCKITMGMFALGMIALFLRNAASLWLGIGGIMAVIDDVLWGLYYVYFFSWAFMFFYTVRAIEACFYQLTKTTIADNANLKAYFQTYNRLVDIASEANDFYDIPVSIVLLVLLLSFLDYTNIALAGMGCMNLVDKLYMYLWVFILLALLLSILGNCQSASDQANSSNEALFKYLVHQKNTINHSNPLLMIHLCAGKRLEFRACKSFTINYNLGLSMIAAYVTYTIVLLQGEHTLQSSPINVTFSNHSDQL